ncbi:AMP-binding protein [Alicycliphilus sp. T452]
MPKPEEYMNECWTVPRLFLKAVRENGSRPCLQIVGGIEQSYDETWSCVVQLAQRFAGHGVAPCERVVLMLGNSEHTIHAWLALNLLNAVDVGINVGYKGESLEHAINLSGASTLVTTSDHLPTLLASRDQFEHLETIILMEPCKAGEKGEGVGRPKVVGLDQLPIRSLAPAGQDMAATAQPWDAASVIYTSGTSGPAKGVVMPHGQVTLLARLSASKASMTEADVFYSFYPMYHMAGKFMSVLAAFSVGAKLVLDTGFRPEDWLKRIRTYGATLTAAHGPMLEMVHALPPSPADREHRLRLIRTAPFPKRIAQDFEQRFGVKGMEVWGMTETGVVCWSNPEEPLRVGSCGKPETDWYEFSVVDPQTDRPVAPGTVGEFVVRPRQPWTIAQGYLAMPERTVSAWRNLWFHTGDCGYVDPDGYVYFVDRVQERIRRRAENISASDIENAALLHPGVLQAAAVGVPSGFEGDDDILLCLVLKSGVRFEPEDMLGFLTGRLPHFMVPRYLSRQEVLPRTPTGKLQRTQLRSVLTSPGLWDRKAAGVVLRSVVAQPV